MAARHSWRRKVVPVRDAGGVEREKLCWHCPRCGGSLTQLSGPHPDDRVGERTADGAELSMDCDERLVFGLMES